VIALQEAKAELQAERIVLEPGKPPRAEAGDDAEGD
jgi:hypothetical protein